jgi:uncharacterized membrane protein HdeD (DUF308 family)
MAKQFDMFMLILGIVGLIMLFRPEAGADAITLMLAVYFLISGTLTIGFALSARVDNLWIYLGEGLVNAVLGLILLRGWPVSGT